MDKIIEDTELGRLVVRVNSRARRLIFRSKSDAIYVTVPPGTTIKEVDKAIEELRTKLLANKTKVARPLIDLDYTLNTQYFKLSLISGKRDEFLSHSELGVTQITCPPHANFADERLQSWLRKVIEEALKRNAKVIFPPQLHLHSQRHNLPYQSLKINVSQGRWGSCSMQKNINLSCYLLLLPPHLIDYVMLHELCHTRQMNHSEHFWALLNQLTDGKALALRAQTKKYSTIL